MWVLLSGGLRRWILVSVAVPVAAKLLGEAGRRLESRNGSTTLSRGLQSAGRLVSSREQREEHSAQQRRSLRRWNR
jgi:hypothetical protein